MKDYTIETGTRTRATGRGSRHRFWVSVNVLSIMSSVLSGDDSDMLAWCTEQFGDESVFGDWYTGVKLHQRRFFFRHKNAAVAFKVRWG
ncbi:MAG: hypothetical protein EOO77_35135 [Oxalobacteraceae bacterium]|nr:MAG: hypothetical protein EOO77_35135 [Oxalobacteraceae bacterium]